ncbi:MAG: hypothetical protein WBB65_04150 [Anaerolineales bacterium]
MSSRRADSTVVRCDDVVLVCHALQEFDNNITYQLRIPVFDIPEIDQEGICVL